MKTSNQMLVLRASLVALLYYCLGKFAFMLSVKHGIVTNVPFFSEGISLSFVILYGNVMALGVFFGQFFLALSGGVEVLPSVGISLLNASLAVFGRFLFIRLQLSPSMKLIRDYAILVVIIHFVLQPFSAILGNLILFKFHLSNGLEFIESVSAWWLGNSIGQLVLTPMVLLLYTIGSKVKIWSVLRSDGPAIVLIVFFSLVLFILTDYIPDNYKFSCLLCLFPLTLFLTRKRSLLGILLSLCLMTIVAFYATSTSMTNLLLSNHFASFVKLDLLIIGLQVSVVFVAVVVQNQESTKAELQKTLLNLEKSKERLSLALQGSSDGLWDWNIPENSVYFSPAWKSMLGYEDDELENSAETLEHLVHPDDVPMVRDYINDFLRKKHQHYEIEYRMLHKDGSSVTILARAFHQVDDQTGNLKRLVGTHVDITGIRKAEEQIRKLSVAVEQNSASIVITDLDGKIEYVNRKFIELSGYSMEEVLGKNPNIVKSGKTPEHVFVDLWDTLLKKKIWKGEFINKSKEGKEYIESAVISPVLDSRGNTTNYIAIKEDITDRRKTELILQEKDERYRLIAENINDVIWVYNLDRKVFTYISPSIYLLRGFTVDEAMQLHIYQTVTSDEQAYFKETLDSRLAYFIAGANVGSEYVDQLQMCCKDGHLVWVENSSKFRYNALGEVEITCVSRNIEARKKMEAEILVQNQQLRELIATKDKFFNIIAHDLRNPFNGILMASGLLVDNIYNYPIENVKEVIGLIHDSAKNAYSLLENLLVWARSQTGRIDFNPIWISSNDLFAEVVSLVDGLAKNKSIKLSLDVKEDFRLFADRNMITTVLRNLATNAVKFTHKNGAVDISASPHAGYVQINVQDTGIGISPEGLKKLFILNEDTCRIGTENEFGTGLGLMLCKEFIDKHSGEILVESEVGKGTVFIIKLPLPSC